MVLTLLLSAYKLCRFFAMSGPRSGAERLAVPGPDGSGCAGPWWAAGSRGPREVSPGASTEVQGALERALPELQQALSALKQAGGVRAVGASLAEVFQLVEEAWLLPAMGREVAQGLCDAIRLDGGLDLLLRLLQAPELETRVQAARLLEQILVAENRDRVARIGLGVILNLAKEREPVELARSVAGILEHMFKHSEETCQRLVAAGGLDAVLYWCRRTDPPLLRHCALALANCALHGGQAAQRRMVEKRAAEWLFPLAFSEDEMLRLHACLAVAVLATNKEVEREVERSGTLALVEPLVASLDPGRFARCLVDASDTSQGRGPDDLQRLVPLLDSSRLEAQCIGAFYLCAEAAIKSLQGKTKVFSDIGAIQSLKRLVSYSTNGTTSALAKRALRLLGEEVPRPILPSVASWKEAEEQQVDGDLLLRLTDEELQTDLGMKSGLTRKRFFRELTELKTFANYATCDRSNLADWLGSLDPRFRQYTYGLVSCGLDRSLLHRVSEQQLLEDCGIHLGVHRARILTAAREMLHSPLPCTGCKPCGDTPDVFISYRRNSGSQLASLLKVHLQLHGFSVFIDVEKLEAGKFEDKLIQSIMGARNFVLVLSAGALDKCMQDHDCKDWVHKEIVTALNCGKNIVPVIDGFQWPEPQALPEDMQAVLAFNGIKWSHEYQEATIEKIIRFLQGRASRDSSAGSDTSLEGAAPLGPA
ncbi:NAD(+) hydrolase SARM1 isoform X2 [Orcinus orca]|uniref:NAD(+) hydrolase SARM1 n=1 Tax=Tursiops truncatus TaxID=9739 RepID=A0A2U4AP59_TURTR|nr:NAD(+) hydrolase SARM1 isoform X2 [Orcinus orca]XP_019782614.1 sterile alpha and TIR motif-containing protein 1 isoform X2 [Tursiops truncatus]XP_026986197.1 sterile alpha and TIR motif-containing protein 1 isoform X2 [Lagenorhynchus obliquidens]XP_059853014.1 NAD(+) hydrolase SARM1 isoform X1 [Delphinus delphis]